MIPTRTDPTIRTRIRVWLLKRIAGDRSVAINLRVDGDGVLSPLNRPDGGIYLNVHHHGVKIPLRYEGYDLFQYLDGPRQAGERGA